MKSKKFWVYLITTILTAVAWIVYYKFFDEGEFISYEREVA